MLYYVHQIKIDILHKKINDLHNLIIPKTKKPDEAIENIQKRINELKYGLEIEEEERPEKGAFDKLKRLFNKN